MTELESLKLDSAKKVESVAVTHTHQSDTVHNFGTNSSQHVSQIALKDLLILSLDKGISFGATEKGKETFQNFRCYTGVPPVRSRADEARVRNALNYAYKEIDSDSKKVFDSKKPDVETGDVTTWNQNRNKTAIIIQERVIDALTKEEMAMAIKNKVPAPKRSAPLVTTLMGRYDKLILSKHHKSACQLKDSMRHFLDKASHTPPPLSSSSSSVLSSSSSSSSSPPSKKRSNK